MNVPLSILDTDQYKLTMQAAVCKLFPREEVQYKFFNRGNNKFPDGFAMELRKMVADFRGLRLTKREKDFLRCKAPYLDPVYLSFLESYEYNPLEVNIQQTGSDLSIDIMGPWYSAIMWEVPLMAMISELYFEMKGLQPWPDDHQYQTNLEKIKGLRDMGVHVAEFGTRRRYSFQVQNNLLSDIHRSGMDVFVGTSNVFFSMEYGITPIGTQAHEWYQFHAARYGYRVANLMGMENWVEAYQGDLGIVLPDTFTTDVFLRSFNTKYAKLFDGGRQDSGDPLEFLQKWVGHYRNLRIKPEYKTIVFSDSLSDLGSIAKIHQECLKEGINDSYGIGTWLTNDVGQTPLNMVIKMVACKVHGDWVQTVKLSDNISKHTGDTDEVRRCKEMLKTT